MKDNLKDIKTMIVVSDLHSCCQLGLCPEKGFKLDNDGWYTPSKVQKKIWGYWKYFWDEWVPNVTKGDKYCVLVNGDAMDGEHHGSKHQVTTNKAIQKKVAKSILEPIVKLCDGRFYMTRGTRAHDGTSGEDVEALAESLGAIPNDEGQHARYELWKYLGGKHALIHALHHIGTTGTAAYESTAVHKEYIEACSEAGRWNLRVPDVIIRSHRHRYFKTEVATGRDRAMAIVTPAWQGKTPFAHMIAGARQAQPQFGGVMLRISEDGELYERHYVERLARPKAE